MSTITKALNTIWGIQENDFDECAAMSLINCIKHRIGLSNFAHMEHGMNTMESLDDAATYLRVAREDMLDEAGSKE